MTFVVAAAVATIAGTAVSTYGQVQAGKAQEEAFEEQARQEKIAAEGRELKRRQELSKVLASNIVSASMSGETGEGSTASLSLETAKQIGTSEAMIGLTERLAEAQTLRKARMARGTANIGAASTLLKGTAKVANAFA